MKLRIKGNSIRLRLTKSEVEQFATIGEVNEGVSFGHDKPSLSYAISAIHGIDEPYAEFMNNTISVFIPKGQSVTWADSEEISIEATQPIGNGQQLRILVEKDFGCLTKRPYEDDPDAFPNPRMAGSM